MENRVSLHPHTTKTHTFNFCENLIRYENIFQPDPHFIQPYRYVAKPIYT